MEPSDVTYLEVSFVCDVSAFINHIVVWQQPPALHIYLTFSSLIHFLLYLTIGILQLKHQLAVSPANVMIPPRRS